MNEGQKTLTFPLGGFSSTNLFASACAIMSIYSQNGYIDKVVYCIEDEGSDLTLFII